MKELLIISGWGTGSNTLQDLAVALGGHFKVRALSVHDLWPAGASCDFTGDSVSNYAKQLGELIPEHGPPPYLLGWSMGGTVAMEAVLRGGVRHAGMALVAASARFCASDGYPCGAPSAELRAFQRALRAEPEGVLTRFFQTVASPHTLDSEVMAEQVSEAMAWGIDELHRGLDYLAHVDLREELTRVDARTLIVHGRDDEVIPCTAGQWLAERIPETRMELMDRMGHDLPRRASAELSSMVAAWAAAGTCPS